MDRISSLPPNALSTALFVCGLLFRAFHQGREPGIPVQGFEIRIKVHMLSSAWRHAMLNAFIQEFESLFTLAHFSLQARHVVHRFHRSWIVRPKESTLGFDRFA